MTGTLQAFQFSHLLAFALTPLKARIGAMAVKWLFVPTF